MKASDATSAGSMSASEMDTADYRPEESNTLRVSVEFSGQTHQGKVRTNNEDQFFIARLAKSMQVYQTSLARDPETRFSEEDGYLMVVADGMGGAAAGERASTRAIESVETFALNQLKWFLHHGSGEESKLLAELRQGFEVADRAVVDEGEANAGLYGMGTTMTMAYSVGRDLHIVHAGDSRAYLFRQGELTQLTCDHTLVQLLIAGGVISPDDARHHARRNVVTNVIGGPNAGVHAEIHKVQIENGDVLLLCSDGLTEPVEDDQIAEALASSNDPTEAADRLISLALKNGGPDNVTVVVARYRFEDPASTG
jgi:protein phosphatase